MMKYNLNKKKDRLEKEKKSIQNEILILKKQNDEKVNDSKSNKVKTLKVILNIRKQLMIK